MTDLASLPTTMLNSPADQQEMPGEFTSHLQAVYSRHESDRKLIAAQKAEIEALRQQLADLRRGLGVVVEIEGRRFLLSEMVHLVKDARSEPPAASQMVTINEDFLKEPAKLHGENGLRDSFVL